MRGLGMAANLPLGGRVKKIRGRLRERWRSSDFAREEKIQGSINGLRNRKDQKRKSVNEA